MGAIKLHYVYDPLCGWCYGASPLIQAAREVMAVQAHAGGMMTGERRMAVTPELRKFVLSHDQRIAQVTGQTFGKAYTDGLLCDEGAVFDSAPPITAVLTAERLGQHGLDLLARLQAAHYVEGRRVAEPDVLLGLAAEIGLDGQTFARAFNELGGAATQAHIQPGSARVASRRWRWSKTSISCGSTSPRTTETSRPGRRGSVSLWLLHRRSQRARA
jgi:putative protein-disulfide isomerase